MKRYIIIGECRLNVAYGDGFDYVQARPSGLMVETALDLASKGRNVMMLSEVANDSVGRDILEYLKAHSIDTSCIECYTDGLTPLCVATHDGGFTLYTRYPATDGFDIIWPRLDEDEDILIYGDYMTLSKRWNRNYTNFMSHVASKGCRTVYIPGDISRREPRVTKVMPQVFENLERASVVVLGAETCKYYFGTADPQQALTDTVGYYCPTILFRHPDGTLEPFGPDKCEWLGL